MRSLSPTVQCQQQTCPNIKCKHWSRNWFVLYIHLGCLWFDAYIQELPDDDDGHAGKASVPLLEEEDEAEADDKYGPSMTERDPMKIAWRYQGLPKVDV